MSDIKYYYVDENSERQGPFFLEDLANHPFTPATLVWRKGMSSWVKAGEVEELSFLFQPGPVAVNSGPDTEEIYRNATLSIANQQFEQARALIDQLLDINPNEPRYLELQEILKQATLPPEPQPEPMPQPEQQPPEPTPQAEGTDDFIFCTQCGQRLSAQTERCPQCGTPVGQNNEAYNAPLEVTEIAATAATAASAQQPEPQPYQPQPEPQQPYQAQPQQPYQGPYQAQPQQPYQEAQPYQEPYQAQPQQQPYQQQPYQQQPYQQQPYPYETETETKSRFPMAAIIGAILAALVLGGVCLYMFVIRPNQSSSKNEPSEWTINEGEDGDTNPGLEDEQTEIAPVAPPDSTSITTSAHKKKYVVVDGVNVRVRTSPALNDYNIITDSKGKNLHPNKGDRLEYLGDYGKFYKVYFKGYECYIAKEFSYTIEE